MGILNLTSLPAGLALFLYGITLMGDGLNLVAGNKLEELIDGLCDRMRSRNIDRLQMGIGNQQQTFVFNDLPTNFERVGDHCSNVAVAMIELAHDVFDTHEYLHSLQLIRNAAFDENCEKFRAKFNI